MDLRRHFFFRNLQSEDGIALLMSVWFTVILLAVAGSLIYYSTANSSSASTAQANQKAFNLAEAGLNEGISILYNSSTQNSQSALPSACCTGADTTTYAGSTINWWGTWNAASSTWTVYGKGTVPAPVSGSNAVRSVYQQVRIGSNGATVAGNPAWGYIFSDNKNGSCLSLANSVQINDPLYATGNMCMDNSSQVRSTASPVTVAGTLQITSSASMGLSTGHLDTFHTGGGCRYGTTGSFTYPCTTTQHVYVDHPDQIIASVSKPSVDMAGTYTSAAPGPTHACTSGSFPPGFDNDSTRNTSKGTVNILTSSAYDCVFASGGSTVGEIKWTPASNALYIKGVVFIDGNIDMAGSQKVDYTGRGSIYANGYIKLWGSEQFCAARNAGSCDYTTGAWDPEQILLCWVAGSYVDLGQSMQLQGAIYAVTDYTQGSSVKVQGPIVANNLTLTSSGQSKWLPFNTLADGMPAGSSGSTATVLPGTWSG